MKNTAVKAHMVLSDRLTNHFKKIYPDADIKAFCDQALDIFELSEKRKLPVPLPDNETWSQKDIILITYADTILAKNQAPLKTLDLFLKKYLNDLVTTVHILPFFPFSSDDGFAVMDYYQVNSCLGNWDDISAIADKNKLMADLVINHTSSRSAWFENFKKGKHPGKDYYLSVDPTVDLSQVVRPRTSPLLKEVQTIDGKCFVWCTFSHDQVDLNFQNPSVLMEFLHIIRTYIDHGVSIFRLDAVAFLWKESCTTCLHLAQTHEIIKLFRTLIQAHAPEVLLITETNVPSHENMSYLGNGDEAHVIYNFPLPPFLLHTLVTENSTNLVQWLASIPEQPKGTTLLNFIASHDGIGLRPVEGQLSEQQIRQLTQCMESFGGKISTRALNDHQSNPYEINISLWDALKGTIQNGPDRFQLPRFVCAHAVMLSLKGIPAFYIHSLLGTENDIEKRENRQSNRAVNRHTWDAETLYSLLNNTDSHHRAVFSALTGLMDIRKNQPAFHPDAHQKIIQSDHRLFVILRKVQQLSKNSQAILCVHNISKQTIQIDIAQFGHSPKFKGIDLTSKKTVTENNTTLMFSPYQFCWLELTQN